MFRLFFLFFLLFTSLSAEEETTVKYNLSAFAVDVVLNWEDMSKFPYDRHFAWSDQMNKIHRYFNYNTMRKRLTLTDEAEFRPKLQFFLKSIGFKGNEDSFRLFFHEVVSRGSGKKFLMGAELRIKADGKTHTYLHWINEYFSNLRGQPFNPSIETSVVTGRVILVSLPPKLAREKGLDFFPAGIGLSPLKFTNKKFKKYLSGLKKEKGVSIVGEYQCRAVSGKTMVVRDVNEIYFPEAYGFIGESVPAKVFDEKTQLWRSSSKIVNISGIEPLFGEPRDVGDIIEITPQVEPDGITVSIDYRLQFLRDAGWIEYHKVEDIRMPVLQALTTETRFTTSFGMTVPIAVSYYKNRSQNHKTAVRDEDLNREILDKCIVSFMAVDSEKGEKVLPFKANDMSFYMSPLGSTAKIAVEKLLEKKAKPTLELKKILVDMGMDLGEKSFIHYDPEYSVVSLFAKASEINKFIEFLPVRTEVNRNASRRHYYGDNEIMSSTIELELSSTLASQLGLNSREKFLKPEVLRKLLNEAEKNKDVVINQVNSVVTQNGNTAVNRDVFEMYFPEYYEGQFIKGKKFMLPGFGDPRDIGTVFELTPQLEPNGTDIEIEMKPQYVDLISWGGFKGMKGYGVLKSFSLDTRLKAIISKPFINSFIEKKGRVTINLSNYQVRSTRGTE